MESKFQWESLQLKDIRNVELKVTSKISPKEKSSGLPTTKHRGEPG